MAVNSGKIDLNGDTGLFDRKNEVLGFKSSMSNNNVGVVSCCETLISNVGGTNDSVGFQMNSGCDVLINGSGKEGFCEEKVDHGLEDGGVFDVCDGGFDGKGGDFSCGLVKNEDEKSVIQCSDGVSCVYGGEEPDKDLVFEFNGGVKIQQECENVREVALSNEVQGVECENEVKNVVVEDVGVMKVADSFVIKDNAEDSRASEFATYKLQDGISYVENMDVNAEESLDVKDLFSRNCHELDAQVNVIQNQTTDIDISGSGISENIQYDRGSYDLVVDLNSYKNTQEDSMPREFVFPEGNFRVYDLVWGKVRGHPWWPGQIYDPSIASEKAKRLRKDNCYLVACFGDQTFAWIHESMIKPFHKHFSELEKQNDLENFRHAVDCALEEASRRVEFGLSCPCMPGEASSNSETEVIANAGVDGFTNATTFEPMALVSFVKSLAQSPFIESDRLDFVNARAQLSAFYRSKGYSQLPEFSVLDRLFTNDMEILHEREKENRHDQINEQVLKTHQGFSQNSDHISRNTMKIGKKNKCLSDLMSESSCAPNAGCKLQEKAGNNSTSRRGRKPKAVNITSDDYFHNSQIAGNNSTSKRGRKRKAAYDTSYDYFHNTQIAGDKSTSRRGRKPKAAHNTSDDCFNNSQTRNLTQLQYVSTDEMLSQLCLAAKDPEGEWCFNDMIHFIAEFRKFTVGNDSAFLEQGLSSEQEHGNEIGAVISTEAAATASTTTPMELCNDSYWTDRIIQIQSISEEQTLLKNQNESGEHLPAAETSPNLGLMHQETEENLRSEPSNHVEHVSESSPTALTLKFSNLDSVPSTTDLNKIFSRFGPLIESKTELLTKSNCARVVFIKRCDAEAAFSSAGKYSIFGPALKSYRLKILPPTPKKGTGKRGRKRKSETSSVDAAAV